MNLKISYKMGPKQESKTLTWGKGEKMLKKLDFLKKYDILRSQAFIRLNLGYERQERKSVTTERLVSVFQDALTLSRKILKNF